MRKETKNATIVSFAAAGLLLLGGFGAKEALKEKNVEACLAEKGITNVMYQSSQSKMPHFATLVDLGKGDAASLRVQTYDFDDAKVITADTKGKQVSVKPFNPSIPEERNRIQAVFVCGK